MPPSWIVIGCLTGRGFGFPFPSLSSLTHFSTLRPLPWQICPRPNPPQLPNPRWQPNTKMCTRTSLWYFFFFFFTFYTGTLTVKMVTALLIPAFSEAPANVDLKMKRTVLSQKT